MLIKPSFIMVVPSIDSYPYVIATEAFIVAMISCSCNSEKPFIILLSLVTFGLTILDIKQKVLNRFVTLAFTIFTIVISIY
jgi:hypothetical protein